MNEFIFNDQAKIEALHRVELPRGIESKAALLDAISIALRFPAYFGRNWDALEECICDLSWLSPGDVMLTHKDLPLSEDRVSLATYLSILRHAVENWKTTGSNLIFATPGKRSATGEHELLVKRRFLVRFPQDTQDAVETVFAK